MSPKIIATLFLDLLLGSARVRSLLGGALAGIVAAMLFARDDATAQLMAPVVLAAALASLVCQAAGGAVRGRRRHAAEQALIFGGCGALLVLNSAPLL